MASAGSSDGDLGMQIAPMVDVVFVLLLFFMASAGVQEKERELGINLPTKGKQSFEGTVEIPIELRIDPAGNVSWNNLGVADAKDSELKDLKSRLKDAVAKFGEKQPVIIIPDPGARHGRVVDVLNAAAASKVKSLSFGS
ncbi:MAG: biopolymer transporter ExbD [Verrucomicrobiae bacterium]|nr:biopolymer transporter ExbD [Verrucomicrobiae bacterium]